MAYRFEFETQVQPKLFVDLPKKEQMTFRPGSQVSVHLAGFWICGQPFVKPRYRLARWVLMCLCRWSNSMHWTCCRTNEEITKRRSEIPANIEEIWDNHWTKQGEFSGKPWLITGGYCQLEVSWTGGLQHDPWCFQRFSIGKPMVLHPNFKRHSHDHLSSTFGPFTLTERFWIQYSKLVMSHCSWVTMQWIPLCCWVKFPHFFGWTFHQSLELETSHQFPLNFGGQPSVSNMFLKFSMFASPFSQQFPFNLGGPSPFDPFVARFSERCVAASVGFAVVALTIWALNSGVQSSHEA